MALPRSYFLLVKTFTGIFLDFFCKAKRQFVQEVADITRVEVPLASQECCKIRHSAAESYMSSANF